MTPRAPAATMRAVIVRRFGGPEVLEPAELPTPAPGPGDVLVRLHAIGVNFADTERRRGIYSVPELPWTPGREGAGVVVAGPGVDGALVGARVSFWSPRAGSAYAQYALAPADELFVLDAATPFDAAAALPLQGLTAWGVVHEAAAVAAGETVLIHAAAGGVGQLAVQLARACGARVLGTASTDEKRARVAALGAEPLAYGDDLAARALEATSGRGVDVVLDSIGRDTQGQSLASLAPFGRLVFYGEASGPAAPVPVDALYERSLRVGAFDARHLVGDPARAARARAALLDALLGGRLRVEIGERLPLDEARRAHELLEARRTTGKVILVPPEGLRRPLATDFRAAAAGGRHEALAGAGAPLLGREQAQAERVQPRGELVAQELVDAALARHEPLPGEGLADDEHLEVRLGPAGHAVHVALVLDEELLGAEGVGERALDAFLAVHGTDGSASAAPAPRPARDPAPPGWGAGCVARDAVDMEAP